MTFKEYLKTPEAKKQIKSILRKRNKLPVCKQSRYMDSSTMTSTSPLPAQTAEQPSLS